MNKQEKLQEIKNSMEFKKWNNDKDGYIIKETCKQEIKDKLLDIIYDENIGGINDLSYEIVAVATGLLDDIETIEDLEQEQDFCEAVQASVYTYDRLNYLNINNQDEITETLKEFNCDIQTACAIWYDNQVRYTYDLLKDYILE